jgi:hypothetical protein
MSKSPVDDMKLFAWSQNRRQSLVMRQSNNRPYAYWKRENLTQHGVRWQAKRDTALVLVLALRNAGVLACELRLCPGASLKIPTPLIPLPALVRLFDAPEKCASSETGYSPKPFSKAANVHQAFLAQNCFPSARTNCSNPFA